MHDMSLHISQLFGASESDMLEPETGDAGVSQSSRSLSWKSGSHIITRHLLFMSQNSQLMLNQSIYNSIHYLFPSTVSVCCANVQHMPKSH